MSEERTFHAIVGCKACRRGYGNHIWCPQCGDWWPAVPGSEFEDTCLNCDCPASFVSGRSDGR